MRLINWTRKWLAVMTDVDSVSIETHTLFIKRVWCLTRLVIINPSCVLGDWHFVQWLLCQIREEDMLFSLYVECPLLDHMICSIGTWLLWPRPKLHWALPRTHTWICFLFSYLLGFKYKQSNRRVLHSSCHKRTTYKTYAGMMSVFSSSCSHVYYCLIRVIWVIYACECLEAQIFKHLCEGCLLEWSQKLQMTQT